MTRPIVVVHAPHLRPAHYGRLTALLARDTEVLVPDLGELTVTEATASVQQLVDACAQPPMVVSHSFGGVVAGGCSGVADYLFLSAFVLAADETGSSVLEPEFDGVAGVVSDFWRALRRSADGQWLTIDPVLAGHLAFSDCTPQDAACAVRALRRARASNFGERPVGDYWKDAPTCYVRTLRDNAWVGGLQQRFAERCDEVTTIDSGHAPFFSRPEELAGIVRARL